MLSLTADNRENGLAASVVQMLFLFFPRETASGWSGSVIMAKASCRYPRSLPHRRHLPALAPCMLVLHQPPASGETVGPPIPGKGGVPSQPTPSPMKAHGPVGEPLATQPMSLNFGNFSQNLVEAGGGHLRCLWEAITSSGCTSGGNHVWASLGVISPESLSTGKAAMERTKFSNRKLSSVQSLSHVRLFATPWTAACQVSLSITNSWTLLRLMSTESVMPCNHLILCCPLLLLPSISPSIRVFSNESGLHQVANYWSFSFHISPSNEHPGLISFRMDRLDLLAVQGTFKSLLQHHSSKASILWCSAFFIVQLISICDYWKNHSLD